MKILLSICLIVFSFTGYCQVIADPAHQQVDFITVTNNLQNPSMLPLGATIQLRVPILNLNLVNGLPAGTCKIKIGLGSKLILDPAFDLSTTNTSAYFNWTATTEGGQVQITGDLIAPVPPNYSAVCAFGVQGSVLGSSTITANFLVTNHNTTVNLSDENPTNNNSSLAYSTIPVIPVTFINIAVKKEDCNIRVSFSSENEINLDRYEIEVSKNGISYTKMGQLPAMHSINYNYSFLINDNIATPSLKIRVKSVDKDGKFQYTETRIVKGICENDPKINLFPNPVSKNEAFVTVNSEIGYFNGRFIISLMDIAGKLINQKETNFSNERQFNFPVDKIAAGQYLLKMQSFDGSSPAVTLKFQKL